MNMIRICPFLKSECILNGCEMFHEDNGCMILLATHSISEIEYILRKDDNNG